VYPLNFFISTHIFCRFNKAEEELKLEIEKYKLQMLPKQTMTDYIFPDIPDNYTLRQKVGISLNFTTAGQNWDAFQTVLSLVSCILYILETYHIHIPSKIDNVFTLFFAIDYAIRYFAAPDR
jgi:hypothetical protein